MTVQTGTRPKYLPAIAVLATAIVFALLQFKNFGTVAGYQIPSILAEGLVVLLVLTMLFVVQQLQGNKQIYMPLMVGFSALLFSRLTDTLEELIYQPDIVTIIFEDLLQIVGIALLIFGTRRWIIQNRKMQSSLHELATTDQLTGAGNRRCFGKALLNELERVNQYQEELSLIMFDIDEFKSINDAHGHEAGDRALVKISELVRKQIRKNDVFARFGGEEFIILAPATGIQSATDLAEKLRTVFEKNPIVPERTVTASFGVTAFKNGDNMDNLLKRADSALYEAKQAGRNCVIVASTLNEESQAEAELLMETAH